MLCTLALTNFSAKINLFKFLVTFPLLLADICSLQGSSSSRSRAGHQEALRRESRNPEYQKARNPRGLGSRRPGKQIFRKTKSEVYEARRQESRRPKFQFKAKNPVGERILFFAYFLLYTKYDYIYKGFISIS